MDGEGTQRRASGRESVLGEPRRERGVWQVRRGCEDGEGERALEVEEPGELRLSERWVLFGGKKKKKEKANRRRFSLSKTDG